MEMLTSSPKEVDIQLNFTEPFASECRTSFKLNPQGDSTRVDWTMTAPNSFMSKVMCVFMDLDEMIGKVFEKGLEQLETAVSKNPVATQQNPVML